MLAALQQPGIGHESAVPYRTPIERHLSALNGVEIAESHITNTSEINLARGNAADAVDQEIIARPPTIKHIVSGICSGASFCMRGRQIAI